MKIAIPDSGGELEVYGDLAGNGDPIAILQVECTYDLTHDHIDIAGYEVEFPAGATAHASVNVELTRDQAEQVAKALLHETRKETTDGS